MESRYLTVKQARHRYGGSDAGWRKWIRQKALGNAVVRLGRLVMINKKILDERLQETSQLLIIERKQNTILYANGADIPRLSQLYSEAKK